MNDNTQKNPFIPILLMTLLVFTGFALSTTAHDFGLVARNEMGWEISRFISTGMWLILAYIFYVRRNREFFKTSFFRALVTAGVCSLIFSIIFGGLGGTVLSYGSAVFYTLISGLLCSSLDDKKITTMSAFGFTIAQIIADMIFLSIAGDFKIH